MNEGQYGHPRRRNWDDIQPPGGVLPMDGYVPIIANSNTNTAPAQHREIVVPFKLWYPHKIKALGVSLTVSADTGGRVWLGIRQYMTDGWPGSLLCHGSGDVTVTSPATVWVPQNAELGPGRYAATFMTNGWTSTAPQYRATITGSNDVNSYMYGAPVLSALPISVAVAVPSSSNTGLPSLFRASDGRLVKNYARDWTVSSVVPAIWIMGEPVLS